MAIVFPSSPQVNDTHTVDGATWVWTGEYWRRVTGSITTVTPTLTVGGTLEVNGATVFDGAITTNASASIGGHVIPDTNITYDLGSATNRFRDIYLSGSSINLGDVVLSATATGLSVEAGGNPALDFATESYVDTAISDLVGGAPEALDTLNELAAALDDDVSYATTITNALAGKQDSSTALTTSTSFGGDISGTYDDIVIADDSHNHTIANVDGLQTALNGKLSTSGKAADSNLLDGLDLHTSRNNEANKVVRTDGNGYIQAGWINTTSGATTASIARIYASNDGYIRYVTPATFRSQVTDGVYAANSHTHSYLPLSGGTITGSLMLDSNNGGTPVYIGRYTNTNEAIGIYVLDRDGFIFMNQDETSGSSYFHFQNNGAAGSTRRFYFNANLHVPSVVKSGTSNFQIAHPLPEMKDSHWLIHTGIEGPNADNLYRGVVTLVAGTASVNLDAEARMTEGTFVALNRRVQCFTTNETDWGAVKGTVDGNILTITAQDPESTSTVSWMVIGERKDQSIYDSNRSDSEGRALVEIQQDDPAVAPRTFEQAQAEALEAV